MTPPFQQIQPALSLAARRPHGDVTLEALAAETSISPHHMHRIFTNAVGETPKRYTTRLRLGRAAALLLSGHDPVLRVALRCGFESHAGFTRAFRRHFGLTPTEYRARGFAARVTSDQATAHARYVARLGPCIGLYHVDSNGIRRGSQMSYEITKKELEPQGVLLGRKRVSRAGIAAAISEVLPAVFRRAQQSGIPITGRPFARYSEVGAGLLTIEPGMPVQLPPNADGGVASDDDGIVSETLPGGTAAYTVHAGAYDQLSEAYAAIESWMESNGYEPAGSPWESYLTDPAEHADPSEWRTAVFWPIR